MAQRIYLIEDDTALRTELAHVLELSGYAVAAYEGTWGDTAARALAAEPDCIVLDLKLPGADGHSICRDIRGKSSVPILMLTSSESEFDEVMAMNLGADDYVTKPFSMSELVARMRAVLRRTAPAIAGDVATFADIVLDRQLCRVRRGKRDVHLGPTEFRLLDVLMQRPGRVFSREQLLDRVWGQDVYVESRTVDVHVGRLRKALNRRGDRDPIRTVRSSGYALDETYTG